MKVILIHSIFISFMVSIILMKFDPWSKTHQSHGSSWICSIFNDLVAGSFQIMAWTKRNLEESVRWFADIWWGRRVLWRKSWRSKVGFQIININKLAFWLAETDQFENQFKAVDRWRYMEWNNISSNEINFGEYYKRIRIEWFISNYIPIKFLEFGFLNNSKNFRLQVQKSWKLCHVIIKIFETFPEIPNFRIIRNCKFESLSSKLRIRKFEFQNPHSRIQKFKFCYIHLEKKFEMSQNRRLCSNKIALSKLGFWNYFKTGPLILLFCTFWP